MKHLIIPILLAALTNEALPKLNTKYAAIYQFTYTKDSLGMDFARTENYLLYRVNNESRFLNNNAHFKDSIIHEFKEKMGAKVNTQEAVSLFAETAAPKIKGYISDLRLMKDFKNKTSTIILYNTSKRHYLKEPLQLEWKMIPGLDTIAGIPCYKAQTQYSGRKYTAWYAPQIPINDGPYVFHGLPGLITKVQDTQKWYTFELKKLNKNPKEKYSTPPFIEQSFQQEIDRKTYVERTTKEKVDPRYRVYYKKVTPEILMALKERRKFRFDLIIEKQ